MDPKYITGSLKRESCKVLLKEFNKEILPGSLAEHPIHHLVHSDILNRMLGIHAVLLADIFLGCCGLLLNGGETIWNMSYVSTVITLNTYLQSLPSHHQLWNSLRWKYSQNNHIKLMEIKTQEQVLKLFSACVVIISIQRNEQNTRFKH